MHNVPSPKKDLNRCSTEEHCAIVLRNVITDNWNRPADAYQKGLHTVLQMYLDENTNLTSVSILKSSGSASFDDSALQAIKKSSPFVELKGLNKNTYEKRFRIIWFHFKPIDLPSDE